MVGRHATGTFGTWGGVTSSRGAQKCVDPVMGVNYQLLPNGYFQYVKADTCRGTYCNTLSTCPTAGSSFAGAACSAGSMCGGVGASSYAKCVETVGSKWMVAEFLPSGATSPYPSCGSSIVGSPCSGSSNCTLLNSPQTVLQCISFSQDSTTVAGVTTGLTTEVTSGVTTGSYLFNSLKVGCFSSAVKPTGKFIYYYISCVEIIGSEQSSIAETQLLNSNKETHSDTGICVINQASSNLDFFCYVYRKDIAIVDSVSITFEDVASFQVNIPDDYVEEGSLVVKRSCFMNSSTCTREFGMNGVTIIFTSCESAETLTCAGTIELISTLLIFFATLFVFEI